MKKFMFVSATGREATGHEVEVARKAGVVLESWDGGYADPSYLARRYDGVVAGCGDYAEECREAGLKLGYFEYPDFMSPASKLLIY